MAVTAVGNTAANSSVRLNAASRDVSLIIGGTTRASFTGAQRDAPEPTTAGSASYTAGNTGLGLGCVPERLGLAYTLTTAYDMNFDTVAPGATDAYRALFVGGAPTISPSELSSGNYASTLVLVLLVEGTTTNNIDVTDGATVTTTSFDLPSGMLKGTLNATGDRPYSITFNATLTPGSTRFQGTATTASGATGKIVGGFFGPGGSEYGFTLAIDDGSAHYNGVGFGKR